MSMNESEFFKRQLESEEDLQEQCNVQYKCMEKLSDNLSQIIIGKKIVEDELKEGGIHEEWKGVGRSWRTTWTMFKL